MPVRTLTMDALDHKTWSTIPGHERYEANPQGQVRSWKIANGPRILKGQQTWHGYTEYLLDGVFLSQAKIVVLTYGYKQMQSLASTQNRDLTAYEISEIRGYEGIKPAWDVAEDFRIYARRVCHIWDLAE